MGDGRPLRNFTISGYNAKMATAESGGILYVVATPIGNLEDLSGRARRVLAEAPAVAAEDTRVARRLLSACGLGGKKMLSARAHNEARMTEAILKAIAEHGCCAYVSDAGTPGISDPGGRLVRAARAAGARVIPIPGPSALTTLLMAAGAGEGEIHFLGFPPRAPGKRGAFFQGLCGLSGCAVLFEAPTRFADALDLLSESLGGGARTVLGRELTKVHEQIVEGTVDDLRAMAARGEIPARGEFCILAETPGRRELAAGRELFAALWTEMPPRRAAALAAKFSGADADALYRESFSPPE